MLSDKLKRRLLYTEISFPARADDKVKALDMLEECVDNLILGMATVERMNIFDREEIEEYVISYMEAFEKRYYGIGEDDFDKFIRDYLNRR